MCIRQCLGAGKVRNTMDTLSSLLFTIYNVSNMVKQIGNNSDNNRKF